MATYIYETIPSDENEKPVRFEVQQSMKDDPLTHHPENGKPVKRVITGGFGYTPKSGSTPPSSSGCCGSNCGCHN
ncbi:zinc ribbon domain-containing protein [Puniceicoccaceae bacterium K14]|nr:zinc ribbon domain-containing protein [Puniceicoccaceae bacterium K14]